MEALKKVIQAIVISNAGDPMTISQLDQDFLNHEGYNLPYEKYGFQQLDAMLLSMTDAVQIKGQGLSALVLPVITQKSKHIREMVVKHKKNGKKRKSNRQSDFTAKKSKLETSFCPRTNASDSVTISSANHNPEIRPGNAGNNVVSSPCLTMEELKYLIKATVISKPGSPLTVAQLAKDFKQHEGTDIPYRDHGFPQLDALLRSIPDVVQLNGQGPSALVYAVTSEKSKHIEVMIKAQKNQSKRTAYSSQSTTHNQKRSNYNSRNRWTQGFNPRNDRSSNGYGNGNFANGPNSNHPSNVSYATRGCNRYPGNGNHANVYASNGYNPNWSGGNGYSVPDHSYAFNGCNAYASSGNGNMPYHSNGASDSYCADLLMLYQNIMGSDVNFPNQGNYLPYKSTGIPAFDALLKPMWDAAQVNSLSDSYASEWSVSNLLSTINNPTRNAASNNYNFFITVNLGR